MKSVFLKLTAAIVIAGEIAKAGEIVEVSSTEAKDLLNRKKAELATEADMPQGSQDGTQGDESASADAQASTAPEKAPKTPENETAPARSKRK
jgi:hypothetical protein